MSSDKTQKPRGESDKILSTADPSEYHSSQSGAIASSSTEERPIPSKSLKSSSQESDSEIVIDYMSKDFASFNTALIEFISRRNPNWVDISPSDFGVVLRELFCYVADELSYYQDRISNERYFRTARERSSVAKHLALIGYQMDSGQSANVLIKVTAKSIDKTGGKSVTKEHSGIIHKGFQVKSSYSKSEPQMIFEISEDHFVDSSYNSMKIRFADDSKTLGPKDTFLLLEGVKTKLKEGDYLLLEEGEKKDFVKLSNPPLIADGGTIISWSKVAPLRNTYDRTVVVCGNILKASHGRTISNEILNGGQLLRAGQRSFTLRERPLTYVTDFASFGNARSTLQVFVNGDLWQEVKSLSEYGSTDNVYEVSIDQNDQATITFGNGKHGKSLPNLSLVIAKYRVGQGTIGNIGRDVITEYDMAKPESKLIQSITNPSPAFGGRDKESAEHAKIMGPRSFGVQERAVTLEDYERLVKLKFSSSVANVKARSIFTGSWNTIFIAVDPKDSNVQPEHQLLNDVREYLEQVKMIGTRVAVQLAKYVPVYVGILVYVDKSVDIAEVRSLIGNKLGPKTDLLGTKGLFHPDNFTFGNQVYSSKIYQILRSTHGITDMRIYRFRRMQIRDLSLLAGSLYMSAAHYSASYGPSSGSVEGLKADSTTIQNLDKGYIPIGEGEIIQIENDLRHPERGILELEFAGI